MNRRLLNQGLGLVLFVFAVGALVVTFPPDLLLGLQMALLAVAGLFFLISGVTDRVRWGTLVGIGNVALGASLVVSGVASLDANATRGEWFYAALVIGGGLTLAAIGVLYVLNHDTFDAEP